MRNAIKTGSTVPRIELVARKIQEDIKKRRLSAGDKYMTSIQVARTFKIGNEVANRAMQLLAQRNIIERRHRAGTFVADGQTGKEDLILKRVHLIVEKQNVETYGVLRDGTISGLHSVLPGCQIQFSFTPETNEEDFIQELLREVFNSGISTGLVLYRSNASVQNAIAQSGIPAVISGSRWPGVANIPSFCRNFYDMGVKSAEYFIARGHDRIAFFTRDDMFTSDHEILDGITDTMTKAGLAANRVLFRSLPLKPFVIQGTAEIVAKSNNRPTAFICREKILSENVSAVMEDQAEIAMLDFFEAPQNDAIFPHITGTIRPDEEGRIIGKMLIDMALNPGKTPDDYVEEIQFIKHGKQKFA
ncbi:MAG: GntR family transcriptional regulator [Anaerohalosphaera sp.]|nr:GntR family transcriptional regulator [Anaerohalosphaera sp.]